MSKKDNYKEALKTLEQLKGEHPGYTLGRHIATAFADYGDVWGISDKEAAFALEKYRAELEYAGTIPENELEKIIEDGKNLDKLFDLEEEDDT